MAHCLSSHVGTGLRVHCLLAADLSERFHLVSRQCLVGKCK